MKNRRLTAIWKPLSTNSRKPDTICHVLIISAIAIFPALITELLRPQLSPPQTFKLTRVHLNDIVIAPMLETLLFQLLPFRIAMRLNWRKHRRILAMIVPFAIAHEGGGYLAIANAAWAGSILALVFHACATRSIKNAVFVTFSAHAAANVMAYLGDYFLTSYLWP